MSEPKESKPEPVEPTRIESNVPETQSTSNYQAESLSSYPIKKTFKDPQDDDDNDPDGEISAQMTASYSEISFKSGASMDSPKEENDLMDNPEMKNFIGNEDSTYFLKLERPATLRYDHKTFGMLK